VIKFFSVKNLFCFVFCICIPLSLSASARIVFRVSFRCVTYLCPRMLLHLAHMPRRFSGLCPPPASSGIMWSTCVDLALLQTVQVGCSRRITVLFFLYSGSLWALLIVLAPSQARLLAVECGCGSCRARLGLFCFVFDVSSLCD
jgi:hypothetical protein